MLKKLLVDIFIYLLVMIGMKTNMANDLNWILEKIIEIQTEIINKIKTIQNEQPGYTPIKGVDYWTNQDKAEIQAYIDSKLDPIEAELKEI